MPIPSLPLSAPPTTILSTSTFGSVLNGTAGHDQLTALAKRVGIVGGAGDDTYYVYKAAASYSSSWTRVVEYPNAGIDTVISASSYTLPVYVENLTLTNTGGSRFAVGNTSNNILTSGAGNDFLTTGGGNDVMYGGAGVDTFRFTKQANSVSWIADFEAGIDRLNLTNLGFKSFAAVIAATEQVGADLKISLGNGQAAMLADATAADLTASDVRVDTPSGASAVRRLTFNAEFDGPLSLNTGTAATAGGIWNTTFRNGDRRLYGNHDEQIYVDPDYKGKSAAPLGLNPFSVEDGILKISARPTDPSVLPSLWNVPYTSGMLSTHTSFQQQYGYFEIRAQDPAGKGMFPAFWLLPTDGTWPPEIDVYEQIGNRLDYVSQGAASAAAQTQNKGTNTGIDMTQGFHTYAMEWTAQTITWFIDGVQSFQIITAGDLHKPMYLILNLAVGGDWPGRPDATVDWSKANLLVDYIRVYSLDPAAPAPGIVLSSATDPLDLSDSFAMPLGVPGTSATFTGAQLGIAGVANSVTVTASYDAEGDLTLTNNAAWNAIKNATITDTAAHGVTVRNFVDVEIALGDGDNTVDISGIKRGTIATGGGHDTITILGTSNSTTANLTTVLAGDGDDIVSFTAGKLNKVTLDGGTGSDRLALAGQVVGTMVGGLGDDVLNDLSTGAVKLTGGAGADTFAFGAGVKATVTDFVAGTDSIELIGITAPQVNSAISGADTLIDIGGGASIRLIGVNLSPAQLDFHFV